MTRGSNLLASLAILAATATGTWAQVDCTDPDSLCTGDPCVIPRLEPADPCVVDFGARDVVIQGLRSIGEVSFTAKSFTLEGTVGGSQNQNLGDNPPSLELLASEGVVLDGAIRLTTFNQTGQVRVLAGGSIEANDPITLVTSIPTSRTGETVRLESGGDIIVRGRIRTKFARGTLPITFHAAGRIEVLAPLRPDDDVLIDAGADLVLGGSIVLRRTGNSALELSATAGGTLETLDKIHLAGGAVLLEAGGDLAVHRPLKSRSLQGLVSSCQGMTIRSTGGSVLFDARVECSGRHTSDPLVVEANGDLTVNGGIKTTSVVDQGGEVSLTSSAGTVALASSIDARGASGGAVSLTGSHVVVSGRSVDTRGRSATAGRQGGPQSYTATAGDMLLSGRFFASEAGVIEGSANGSLTATGDFRAGAGGCIALDAGGPLDTSGASFEPGLSGACP